MRDRSGGPNLVVRLLAVLVALALAWPLTMFLLSLARRLVDLIV